MAFIDYRHGGFTSSFFLSFDSNLYFLAFIISFRIDQRQFAGGVSFKQRFFFSRFKILHFGQCFTITVKVFVIFQGKQSLFDLFLGFCGFLHQICLTLIVLCLKENLLSYFQPCVVRLRGQGSMKDLSRNDCEGLNPSLVKLIILSQSNCSLRCQLLILQMIGMLRKTLYPFSRIVKTPSAEDVKQYWNDYTPEYNVFDLAPQTFYYSLSSLMQLHKAENILEVACGTGRLLSFAMDKKRKECQYLASDIASNMVQKSKDNLKQHFLEYESKLTFEEWCQKQNLQFQVLNAEEPIPKVKPFDRIFCNLALMITPDPLKLLKNMHSHAAKGCLFGVSVWGSKQQNTLFSAIRESLIQSKIQLPDERSNFHLYKKVGGLAEKTGWEVVLNWQQNVLFPVLEYKPEDYPELLHHQINRLPEHQRDKVKEILYRKLEEIFRSKKGLNFSVDMFVLRKK